MILLSFLGIAFFYYDIYAINVILIFRMLRPIKILTYFDSIETPLNAIFSSLLS